eukprot:2043230-Prymnesium_polylepis.1
MATHEDRAAEGAAKGRRGGVGRLPLPQAVQTVAQGAESSVMGSDDENPTAGFESQQRAWSTPTNHPSRAKPRPRRSPAPFAAAGRPRAASCRQTLPPPSAMGCRPAWSQAWRASGCCGTSPCGPHPWLHF